MSKCNDSTYVSANGNKNEYNFTLNIFFLFFFKLETPVFSNIDDEKTYGSSYGLHIRNIG